MSRIFIQSRGAARKSARRRRRATLLLSLVCCTTAAAECIVVEGNSVLVRDLSPYFDALKALPSEQALLVTPAVGLKRWVSPAEMDRIAGREGAQTTTGKGFCVERVSARLSESSILQALRKVFPEPDVGIEIVEFSLFPVTTGEIEFTRSGLSSSPVTRADQTVLWRGRVAGENGKSQSIWVRVKLTTNKEMLVAARDLSLGQLVAATDLTTALKTRFPGTADKALAPEEIIGKAARGRISAGEILTASRFAAPYHVAAGQSATLVVSNGLVRLKLPVVAEGNGRAGDHVWLKQPSGSKKFRARVIGPQQLILEMNNDSSLVRDRNTAQYSTGQ